MTKHYAIQIVNILNFIFNSEYVIKSFIENVINRLSLIKYQPKTFIKKSTNSIVQRNELTVEQNILYAKQKHITRKFLLFYRRTDRSNNTKFRIRSF